MEVELGFIARNIWCMKIGKYYYYFHAEDFEYRNEFIEQIEGGKK